MKPRFSQAGFLLHFAELHFTEANRLRYAGAHACRASSACILCDMTFMHQLKVFSMRGLSS